MDPKKLSPRPNQCNFFVERKKRFCRMQLKPGIKFCAEHDPTPVSEKADDELRVPCPLDPKHTCYKSKLKKHLKVCNAKPKQLPSYIMKGCNSDGCISEKESRTALKDLPTDILKNVIDKVERIFEKYLNNKIINKTSDTIHKSVQEHYNELDRGENGRKHLIQSSSLIHILESYGLIKEKSCVVEMGAGKGGLSYYISKAIDTIENTSVLLVERAAHRHKKDNKIDNTATHRIERIRADINDLLLHEVDVVKQCAHLVGVSKHLCGVATDFALRCLTNKSILEKTKGILMATCCHHQCIYQCYVGQKFAQDNGISKQDFDVICGLVSWATCGDGYSRDRRKTTNSSNPESKKLKLDLPSGNCSETDASAETADSCKEEENIVDMTNSDMQNAENITSERTKNNLNLSYEAKAEIGRKAKGILDYGRAVYLEELGFSIKLCHYVNSNISPENVCILAYKCCDNST